MLYNGNMHRLSNVNEQERTAYCSECAGIVSVKKRSGKNGWLCRVKVNSDQRKYVRKRRTMPDGFTYTHEQKESLAVEQDHKCAICRKEAPLKFDHNHSTLEPRGLLCHQCNTGIGMLGDNVANLHAAVEYLSRYS